METRSVRVVRALHMPVVQTIQVQILSPGHMAGPSSWLGHQPLKLETRVRVPHPLHRHMSSTCRACVSDGYRLKTIRFGSYRG